MAIEIKEYVGFSSSQPTNHSGIIVQESIAATATPQQMISPNSLMVEIEGIHSDVLTINCTKYSEECLKKSIPYWTSPYEKAVIMHHNDEDGQIIGRVKKAEMIDSKRSGTPAINFTCNIGDENGIKGIKNGTLATVSIGAVAYDVRCSICGENVAICDCEHEKGHVYDGKLCYWTIEEMEPREVSYVILPSDKYAQTMKVYKPGKKELKESVEVRKKMSVCDEILKQLTEGVDDEAVKDKVVIDEEVKDKKDEDEKKEAEEKPVVDEEKEDKVEEEKDEEKAEEKEEEEKEEDNDDKKSDEDDNKDEEDSNKEDRDAIIEDLKKELAELKSELDKVKKQLKETKKLKEKVDLELAKFKVQEKVNVARDIKVLKESIGIECGEAEDMAKDNTIEELNLIYKTLKETCSYTKLPGKLVMESIVDNANDNISGHKEIKESASTVEDDRQDYLDLETLYKRLFK
ncbi:MAG: hypothetical protein MSA15_15865 [Clostridium sp.]|nr:hypothetical protein [Clostridium sp.]